MSELTQHQKILTLMCRHRAQEWWLPIHFMDSNLGDLFVGYEASARLSELAKDNPQMIQSLPDGRFKKRRIRFETIHAWLPLIARDLADTIRAEVFKAHRQTMAAPAPVAKILKQNPPQQATLLVVEPTATKHTGGELA